MEPGADRLLDLRLHLARHALGLAHSWEVTPIADRALANGVYSDVLAELASLTDPIASEVGPLLERVRRELGLSEFSRSDAAWFLVRHAMERILNGSPREHLALIHEVTAAARDVLPSREYVGDSLDLGSLLGIYWSYSEPGENSYAAEQRTITDESERLVLLDTLARREAKAWLERHPH